MPPPDFLWNKNTLNRGKRRPYTGPKRLMTINGVTKPAVDWAKESGLSKATLLYREGKGITGEALLAPADYGRKLNGGDL